jgi:hypothetical protein
MWQFLQPVSIANVATETFSLEANLRSIIGGVTITAHGSGGTTFSLVGSSGTGFDEGLSSFTFENNGDSFSGQTIYDDGRPAAITTGTLAFASSLEIGTTALSTVTITTSEVTTSDSTTHSRWTSASISTQRFSDGSSYSTSKAIAETTTESTTFGTFTSVTTFATATALTTETTSTGLGPEPYSFNARVYAEPGEVLYVYTGGPGIAWPAGPGWVTCTSALITGPAAIGGEVISPTSNTDNATTVILDLTYALTWNEITTISTRTLAVGTFNETFSGLTTITAAVTSLTTSGGGAQIDTTLNAGGPLQFGFRDTTITDITTVTDFVTDTEGAGGDPRTLVTSATTTRLVATFRESEVVERFEDSFAVVAGDSFFTTHSEWRTYSTFAVTHLTNWADGFAANPYGPAARLRRVPFNGWQAIGAHGVNRAVFQDVVSGGVNPEFAMLGGVQLATETDASVSDVQTAQRTIEAKTFRDLGHAILLGQQAMRSLEGETALYPYGAAFFASHGATLMTDTTFAASRHSHEFFTVASEQVFETIRWMQFETITEDAQPVDPPADLAARVTAGPLCNSTAL